MTGVTTLAVCLADNYSCMHRTVIRPINCTHKCIQRYSVRYMPHVEKSVSGNSHGCRRNGLASSWLICWKQIFDKSGDIWKS